MTRQIMRALSDATGLPEEMIVMIAATTIVLAATRGVLRAIDFVMDVQAEGW